MTDSGPVAEAVLVGSAGVLVIEPLIKLSRSLLETVPYSGSQKLDFLGRPARRRDYVGVIGGVLDTGLLISLVLAIYSATQTGDAYKSADKAHLVTELRRVSAIIYCGASPPARRATADRAAAVIVAILIVALLYFHMQHTLASRPTYYLLFVAILMMVTCAYRLASAYGNAGARTRAAFWLALALPELCVCLPLCGTAVALTRALQNRGDLVLLREPQDARSREAAGRGPQPEHEHAALEWSV